MMRIKEGYQWMKHQLQLMYEPREASMIAAMVMQHITDYSRAERLVHEDQLLNDYQTETFQEYLKELLGGKPVQYVLGTSWFQNMPFKVDERVLIPRPETEELVEYVKAKYKNLACNEEGNCNIIDIGTGSGCIAVSLKKAFPLFEIWAIDKSLTVLELAKENARNLEAEISFHQTDILGVLQNDSFPAFDAIVSNPPYIPMQETKEMGNNIIGFEPHEALFVTDEDPLQFYKAILAFSEHHLLRGGMIFFETHELFANEVVLLLEENEFEQVQLKKDFQGKDRIVIGKKMGASL